MARLQVLFLPSEKVGEAERTPFALVVDEVAYDTPLAPALVQDLKEFGSQIGAAGTLVTTDTVEVL